MTDREQLMDMLAAARIPFSVEHPYRDPDQQQVDQFVVLSNDRTWQEQKGMLPKDAWAGMLVVFEFDENGRLIHAHATE